MVGPEFKWPITPFTPSSTRRWATLTASLGSPWSSSDTSSNVTGTPPITSFCRLSSLTASLAPDSASLPR
ncbi:hypothetical protein Y025_5748 [Burkholderia pseudomallei TSV32]|nr:hypothetical protein Y025_5748 [Burkholderia pseudomallei TSV32]KGX94504.1 hypothetical protein X997_5838 [Burkholderia pseudomallei A79C]